MTNKKNKFFTFFFSIIPGAGEMYLGFYKMGISLMALFAVISAITEFLDIYISLFFLPIIWFYSFFHVHNLNSLPDEEFYALEDYWLIHVDQETFVFKDWADKYRKLIAGILILFGISMLWNILTNLTYNFIMFLNLPDYVRHFIYGTSRTIPQGVIAFLIIVLGVKMIKNKKENLQSGQDSGVPSPPCLAGKENEHE